MSSSLKPKIFVSSTIYDFSDLRSSLKYWLNELGYEVLLSEYTDFTKDIDLNSFDACLKTISQCNYFILLIGSRVGGFFDEKKKVSITRMEYRTAYEIAKKDNSTLKLLIFVRRSIWTIREDRAELYRYLLSDYLNTHELSMFDIKQISNHKSKLLVDSATTFSFLDEVGRKDEMKLSMKGLTNFPKANWVHQFSDFEEIIATLKNELLSPFSIEQKKLEKSLHEELAENMADLVEKSESGKIYPLPFVLYLKDIFNVISNEKTELRDSIQLTVDQIKKISLYTMFVGFKDLKSTYAEAYLRSGNLVYVDPITKEIEEGNLCRLIKLHIKWIQWARKISENAPPSSEDPLFKIAMTHKHSPSQKLVDLTVFDILHQISLYSRYVNVFNLHMCLIRSLMGHEIKVESINLNSQLLFKKEKGEITPEEVTGFVENYFLQL